MAKIVTLRIDDNAESKKLIHNITGYVWVPGDGDRPDVQVHYGVQDVYDQVPVDSELLDRLREAVNASRGRPRTMQACAAVHLAAGDLLAGVDSNG
jgi:hypothetical protein